jgi:hypothetical protein
MNSLDEDAFFILCGQFEHLLQEYRLTRVHFTTHQSLTVERLRAVSVNASKVWLCR